MENNEKIQSCKRIIEQLVQFALEKPLQSLLFIGMNENRELVYGKSNMQFEEIYSLISILKSKIDSEYISDEIDCALNSILDAIYDSAIEDTLYPYIPQVDEGIKVDENAYDLLESVLDEYTERKNTDKNDSKDKE